MSNIEKEILNQFLVDYVGEKILLPQGDGGSGLSRPPSEMSVPGSLAIKRPLKENKSSKVVDHKTGFSLAFKLSNITEKYLTFNIGFNYSLYYKEYPKYEDLAVSDLKFYISRDILGIKRKIYKKIKENNPQSQQREVIDELNKQFKCELLKLYNENNIKEVEVIIEKIVASISWANEGKQAAVLVEDEDFDDIEISESVEDSGFEPELKKLTSSNFIFSEEDFEDKKLGYDKAIVALRDNDAKLYKQLFKNVEVNFVYKKIDISIIDLPITISLDGSNMDTSSKNLSIEIKDKVEKQLKSKLEDLEVSTNILGQVSLFDYLTFDDYEKFKNKSLSVNKINFFYPKINFLINGNSLSLVTSAWESKAEDHDHDNYVELFDDKIFNLNLKLTFPEGSLVAFNNYNQNQHYKYSNSKAIYCSSLGVANENVLNEDNSVVIQTTWNPKYYLPRVENRQVTKKLVNYKHWTDAKSNISDLDEVIQEYESWCEKAPTLDDKDNEYLKQDRESWKKEISDIRLGIDLLQAAQKTQDIKLRSIYLSWVYLNESFSGIDEKYQEWRLFQLCYILTFIPYIVLRDEAISNKLIDLSVITKEGRDEVLKQSQERVSLLYFSAGGGKTEAFLSVVIYSLFFERLNGTKWGLTAMIKYPLRLVLTQQTNRVFKAICAAEVIRRKHKICFENKSESDLEFDRSFTLGIWVGRSSTPNTIEEIVKDTNMSVLQIKDGADLSFNSAFYGLAWETDKIQNLVDSSLDEQHKILSDLKQHSVSNVDVLETVDGRNRYLSSTVTDTNSMEDNRYKKIVTCPFCKDSKITLRIYQSSLMHFCLNRQCYWNQTTSSFRALPFYIVDEDVYSRYPSVIVSTTDKLARFGYNDKSKKGLPDNRHLLGMFSIAPYYEKGTKKLLWDVPKGQKANVRPFCEGMKNFIDVKYKFPSLVIQDETHLLIEGLGSFSAVFERNFLELIKSLDKFLKSNNVENIQFYTPHVIAATATIAFADKQILPIYNKSIVSTFPAPGYCLYENFYSHPIKKEAATEPNDPQKDEYLNYEISRIYNGFFLNDHNYYLGVKRYSLEYHKAVEGLSNDSFDINIFKKSLKNIYYLQQFEKLEKTTDFSFEKFLLNNKDTNQQLFNKILINYCGSKNRNDKLKSLEAHLFDIENKSDVISGENQKIITGDVEQSELQSILKTIDDKNSAIRSIYATQSISHGVDSDKFNAMVFHGFPEFISEYIQASARIGRTNVGLVSCFPLFNNKDNMILNNFEGFHRFIDRPVLSNKIDMTTKKIISRSLLSLFSCWFFNVKILEESLNLKNHNREDILKPFKKKNKRYSDYKEEFTNYVHGIFANQNKKLCESTQKKLDDEIKNMLVEVYSLPNVLIEDLTDLARSDSVYFLMTSLRDAQDTATIKINKGD